MTNGMPVIRYLTFFGPIRQPATTNFRTAICGMVNEGAKEIIILFASDGGSTHDAISLFTYLKAQPAKITMHAIGIVGSVAIPVFLAGTKRVASKHSRFFFHDYTWTFDQGTTMSSIMLEESSILTNNALAWSKEVIKSNTKLTDGDFQGLKLFDHPYIMDPASAAAHGLVSAVAEPAIPAGSQPRVVV